MAKIIFENTGKEVELPDGSSIEDACEQAGLTIACGQGFCGVCVVDVIEGMDNLTEPTKKELEFFGEIGTERLACQCKILMGTVRLAF